MKRFCVTATLKTRGEPINVTGKSLYLVKRGPGGVWMIALLTDNSDGLGGNMTGPEIDEAILAVALPRWQKVAMVIVKVAERLEGSLPEGDAGYHVVARRIEAPVADARLAAQGNIERWRHREVRLPQ